MRSNRRFPRLTLPTSKEKSRLSLRLFSNLGLFAGRDLARRSRHRKRSPKRFPNNELEKNELGKNEPGKNEPGKSDREKNEVQNYGRQRNLLQPRNPSPAVPDRPVAAAVAAADGDGVAAAASRPWLRPLLPLPPRDPFRAHL
jgi:hypothetical protein